MGKAPCCSKIGLHKGPWSTQEDMVLTNYIQTHGEGQWRSLPKKAGLLRCGKSCRLRWMNYLRPGIKRGNISADEEDLILRLHKLLGNRWSLIAGRLPGRTDNEIKNYWNTHLIKKLKNSGIELKGIKMEIPKKGKIIGSKKNGSQKNNQNLKVSKIENEGSKGSEEIKKVEIFVPKPIRVFSGSSSNVSNDMALSSSSSHEVNNNEEAKVEKIIPCIKSHSDDENIQENIQYNSDWDFGFDQICAQGDDQVLIDGCQLLFEDSMMPTINNKIDQVYDEYLKLL